MPFNPNRLKVQLKLAINRLKLAQQKKNSINKRARKEIAALLENSKEESARIRVEGVIREDYYIEAMEMLELYCELLMARFGVLEQMKHCDSSISEAVHTLIYAAPRSEIKELSLVRDQLIAKYGKEFAMNAIDNKNNCVSEKLISKLMFSTADPFLVNRYLEEIAKSYNINWKLNEDTENSLFLLDSSLNSKVSNNKLEPYTALPDMELLMSLDNDDNAKGGKSNSPPPLSSTTNNSKPASTSELPDPLLPDVPSFVPPDDSKNNKLGNSSPPNDNLPSVPNDKGVLPPPYSKNDNSNDALPDFDELVRRLESLKRK